MTGRPLSGTNELQLYCMSSGTFREDQSAFTYGRGMGTEVEVPTLMFLIVHPSATVLFETGLDPEVAKNPSAYLGTALAERHAPQTTPEECIVAQLSRLGLQPDDITHVVLSCLYWDHAGGLKNFPHATIVVQEDELREALWPSRGRTAVVGDAYIAQDLEGLGRSKIVTPHSWDFDLLGDGSIMVLRAPCHSRGEQALLVRLPHTGPVLLPAGVIPQSRNYDDGFMTGRLLVSPDEAIRSVTRLESIAQREDARLLFHHDIEAWASYKHAPAFYG
jgi:N-acyl homoserine lactone hydrolase